MAPHPQIPGFDHPSKHTWAPNRGEANWMFSGFRSHLWFQMNHPAHKKKAGDIWFFFLHKPIES